jgi:hypothetical protein
VRIFLFPSLGSLLPDALGIKKGKPAGLGVFYLPKAGKFAGVRECWDGRSHSHGFMGSWLPIAKKLKKTMPEKAPAAAPLHRVAIILVTSRYIPPL